MSCLYGAWSPVRFPGEWNFFCSFCSSLRKRSQLVQLGIIEQFLFLWFPTRDATKKKKSSNCSIPHQMHQIAPLGLELGLVFNHSPGSIQARWETLSVKQDSCLWWRVRVADTAPNAPNCMSVIDRIPQIACRSLTEFPKLHVGHWQNSSILMTKMHLHHS